MTDPALCTRAAVVPACGLFLPAGRGAHPRLRICHMRHLSLAP